MLQLSLQPTPHPLTALRAFVQRVPPVAIARLYFSEDSDGNAPTAGWLNTYLRQMQIGEPRD
ncbi:hypothetical protein OH764_34390 (plasmid) [Burkholderia sp. M6-3]